MSLITINYESKMSDTLKPPILNKLIKAGIAEDKYSQSEIDFDEEKNTPSEQTADIQIELEQANIEDDKPEMDDLSIDSEIRAILDKHMAKAYDEIIELLNRLKN